MNTNAKKLGFLFVLFLNFQTVTTARAATLGPNFHLAPAISIQGKGGWDALSVDADKQLLFLSHFDRVMVVDLQKKQVIKEILDTPGVHAIALALDQKKAYSSNGKEGKVSVLDLNSLTTKTKIPVGENPDAIVYQSKTHQVYAFNAKSNSVSIIDALSDKVLETVALPGKPEFAVADSASGRIYVNLEDKNSVAVLDSESHKVFAVWKWVGCEGPSGIALDSAHHHLFSVCENQVMAMLDTLNGATLAHVATGEGTDGADFDPGLNLVYSSNGKSATISVVRVESEHQLRVVQTVPSQLGARTMAVDPKTHRLYLPTADFQPPAPGQRPKPVDGTQRLLVFEP